MGSNESMWPRRENADGVHNRRAIELKIVEEQKGMCDDVDHEDALYKRFLLAFPRFLDRLMERKPHNVPYQTSMKRIDFVQCQS
jgi:hypothetical protein